MTLTEVELPFAPDERPPVAEDVPKCVVCGVELVYKGTGRKPTKCDEHRRGGRAVKAAAKSAGGTSSGASSTNERLATQAADVLCQVNEMGAVALMLGRLFGTASALSGANDAFREQAFQALLLDPGLCRSILRGGAKSGKFALMGAYAMLLVGVAPVAIEEIKELRAANAASAAEDAEAA